MAVRWTPERVVDAIRRRQALGQDLSTKAVVRDENRLYSAAQRLLGSWRTALEAAGISIAKTARLQRNIWDRPRVIAAIRKLHAAGRSVKAREANEALPGLVQAAYVYIGSWRTAVEEAGIDPSALRRSKGRRKPRGYWSDQRVIEEIRNRADEGLSLVLSKANREAGGLVKAAFKFCGGWAEAVEDAGFNYDDIRLGRVWTKRRVVEMLQERSRSDKPVTMVQVIEDGEQSLSEAARRLFGSWPAAVRAAGLASHRIRRRSHIDETVSPTAQEIQKLAARGHSLSEDDARRTDRPLWRRAVAEFGSWTDAIRASGLRASKRHSVKWTRQRLRQTVEARIAAGKSLSIEAIQREAPGLFDAATRAFGGWYLALDALGFDSSRVRRRRHLTKDAVLREIHGLALTKAWDVLRSASNRDRPLYAKACAEFGSWENALRMAGLDPSDPRLLTRQKRKADKARGVRLGS